MPIIYFYDAWYELYRYTIAAIPDRPRVDTAVNTAVHTSHGVWVHSCSIIYGILVRIHIGWHRHCGDVMSLDRWVDAIQRIDSPEYIEKLY